MGITTFTHDPHKKVNVSAAALTAASAVNISAFNVSTWPNAIGTGAGGADMSDVFANLNVTGGLVGSNSPNEYGVLGNVNLSEMGFDLGSHTIPEGYEELHGVPDNEEIEGEDHLNDEDLAIVRNKRQTHRGQKPRDYVWKRRGSRIESKHSKGYVGYRKKPPTIPWQHVTLLGIAGEKGEELLKGLHTDKPINERIKWFYHKLQNTKLAVDKIRSNARYYGLGDFNFNCLDMMLGFGDGECDDPNFDKFGLGAYWNLARVLSIVRMPVELSTRQKQMDGYAWAFGHTFLNSASDEIWKIFAKSADQKVAANELLNYMRNPKIKASLCHSIEQYESLFDGTANSQQRMEMARELIMLPPSAAMKREPCDKESATHLYKLSLWETFRQLTAKQASNNRLTPWI